MSVYTDIYNKVFDLFLKSKSITMEWLNMKDLQANGQKFDHSTYTQLKRVNPKWAEAYMKQFQDLYNSLKNSKLENVVEAEPTPIEEVEAPLEVKTEPSEGQSEEKVEAIVFTDEDIDELKKVYKAETWKNAHYRRWWDKLVEKINEAKANK